VRLAASARILAAGVALGAFLTANGPASAAPERTLPKSVDVRADAIAFFPSRALLAADGSVRVNAGGRTIEADGLRFDLSNNRLLFGGHVHVLGSTAPAFAAYHLELASGEAFALSLDPQPAGLRIAPDGATSAEIAPEGVYDVVDVTGERPYIRSRHATVRPNVNVRFSPADFPTGTRLVARSPMYLYTFDGNSSFGTNALPPATFDQPYALYGNENTLLAAHFRYDSREGAELGFDEHLVDNASRYAVVSYLPLRSKRVDLISYRQLGATLVENVSGDLYPGYAAATYALQQSGRVANARIQLAQSNGRLSSDLSLTSTTRYLGNLIGYRFQAGYGFDRDALMAPFPQEFRTTLGGSLLSPYGLHGPFHTELSANYDLNSTSYDYGHQISSQSTTLTLIGRPRKDLSILTYAQVQQSNNRYAWGADTFLGLPDPSLPYIAPDGSAYPGYFAYRGLSTLRTYATTLTFTPHPPYRLDLSLVHAHDFPQYGGLGRPPLSTTLTLQAPLGARLLMVCGRTYTFGWGGQYLVPQYTFSLTPL
jgi:hypothetical protein